MAESGDRQKARRRSHRDGDFALAGMLELVLTLPLEDEHKGPLVTAALATVMALGRERVLQAATIAHPEAQPWILAAINALDQQMADDPNHFLHGVLPVPEAVNGGSPDGPGNSYQHTDATD